MNDPVMIFDPTSGLCGTSAHEPVLTPACGGHPFDRLLKDAILPLPRHVLHSVKFDTHVKAVVSAEANGVTCLETPPNNPIRDNLARSR